MKQHFLLLFTCVSSLCFAQKDTLLIPEEEEDYSQYNNVVEAPTKRYCSSKVLGISPSKLISLGYDYVAPHNIIAGVFSGLENSATVNSASGMRIAANFPVISNTKWMVNLGVNWWETNYSFKDADKLTHPLLKSMNDNGLRTSGINATVFMAISLNILFRLFTVKRNTIECSWLLVFQEHIERAARLIFQL